jgi:hypothetical protein
VRDIDVKYQVTQGYNFWFFDPEGDGLVFFKTAEDRDAWANEVIPSYCEEVWSEEVEGCCAGVVTHCCGKVNVILKPSPEQIDEEGFDVEGNNWDNDYTEICDYTLVAVEC